MSHYFVRAMGRINRMRRHLVCLSQLLFHPVKLPVYPEAKSFLEKQSPDPGGSCWTDRGFAHQARSVTLSVIIPAYNVEKYIIPCMESVLSQQVSFSFEVIVVNDGSIDQTAHLLKRYGEDPRVSIIHQPNQGLSEARNTGIYRSKGEYLCFVDSDDELSPGALNVLMTTALNEQAMVTVGSYVKCLRDGTVQYTKRFQSGKADYRMLSGFAHGRIIHHSIFQNLRFPSGYWYEDSIMAQIVHPMSRDVVYTVSEICYQYYSNDSGISFVSKGNKKSLDSLWITVLLLAERSRFGLRHDPETLDYFLSMTRLTYKRTMDLGVDIAQCVFVIQSVLMEHYYSGFDLVSDPKKQRIQKALSSKNFKKYVLACES